MNIDLILGIINIDLIATTPLVFAGIGELVTEKTGVLNLGVEGMMLVGAVTAFVTLVITGSYFLAFLFSIISGILMSGVFAFLVLNLMSKYKILQIPVIDKKKIVGLNLWNEVSSQRKIPNIMVIMAGGKGKRLGKYTKNCPKPLLLIDGKPMLEQIIERAKLQGFNNFLISINYLGHMIKNYFSRGEKWNVKIDYINEKLPLGTGGALKLISPKPKIPRSLKISK